jgi:hypothetical protein
MKSLFVKRDEKKNIDSTDHIDPFPIQTPKEEIKNVINVSLLSETLKCVAYHGNNELLEELLKGHQVQEDVMLDSILIAVESNHSITVSILLKYVNLPSDLLYRLLLKAIRSGNTKMVKVLVSSKNFSSSIITPEVISIACERGVLDIIAMLLSIRPSSATASLVGRYALSEKWDIYDILLSYNGLKLIH